MQKTRFMLRCSLISQCDFNHAAKLHIIIYTIASPNETKTDQNETNSNFYCIFAPKYCDYVQLEGILANKKPARTRR